MKRNRWSSVPVAGAVDSVAAVAVVLAESAIAGNRLTLIEQAKGAMKAWHPFFVCFSRIFHRRNIKQSRKGIGSRRGGSEGCQGLAPTILVQSFTVAN
jgi:hypothetical protein